MNSQSSKADETKALRAFAEKQAGQGSYLASLLNEDMLKWFEEQVKDDMGCDLFGAMDAWMRDATKYQQQAIELDAKLTAEAEKSEAFRTTAQKTAEWLKKERDEREAEAGRMEKGWDEAEAGADVLKAENETLRSALLECLIRLAKLGEDAKDVLAKL